MKILHLYDEKHFPEAEVPLNRGIYEVIFNLSRQQMKRGHNVKVLIRRDEECEMDINGITTIIIKSVSIANGPYVEVNKPFGFLRIAFDFSFTYGKVNKFLRKSEFDVIHAHFPLTSCFLVTLNKDLRNKMVYTAHVGEEAKRFNFDGKAPLALKLFSPDLYLMKRVRKVVVLNENLKKRLVEEKGIEEERITVIPNGIDVRKFDEISVNDDFREKYGIKEPTVLFVGTITPRKGVEYLVKAAKILKEEGCKANFILTGSISVDPEYARKIKEYVKLHKLNVNITGFVPYEDLKTLYAVCDIFVLPSLEEGFGMVLTEAMASGKPLIGSNVGGIPMQIRDGWNGFLVEPGNEKQLAEKIRYLIDNPEERERMGGNSRKLAREEFDWKKIAERYLKVYEEVAK